MLIRCGGQASMLFPVTTVGSWARPPDLIRAPPGAPGREISEADFAAVADQAVLEALRYQEDAGVDIITDGEQRRDNFYSFVVDKIQGMRLMAVSELLDYVPDRARFEETLRALDVPSFAIKSPVAVEKLRVPRRPRPRRGRLPPAAHPEAHQGPAARPLPVEPRRLVRATLARRLSHAGGPRRGCRADPPRRESSPCAIWAWPSSSWTNRP